MARYGDAWTHTAFYLVRDEDVAHGTGNWIFVSGTACGITAGRAGTYHWLPHPRKPKHKAPTAHMARAASRASA